ncbi:MAG: hypothetical protein AAGH15_03320 [Myxococcota bacterium]
MATPDATTLTLHSLAVVERFPNGDFLAYAAMDPEHAAHAGDEESALEELRLFLSESLSFAPAHGRRVGHDPRVCGRRHDAHG